MSIFQYAPEIIERFPNTVGGVIIGQNVRNAAHLETLQQAFQDEQDKVKTRLGDTPLSEIATLAAWRGVFRGFGTDPTKYRSAPEALLRRLTKKDDLPSINALVDIGNLISIRYALPVCVIDRDQIAGGITVHFADGTEAYTELHSDEIIYPEVGEVIFTDARKEVFARRWCWRQSMQSTAQVGTTQVVVTIEAQHEHGHRDINAAVEEMIALFQTHCGGTYDYAILDAGRLTV
ncbi:MAG: hypothetical protein OHK0046_45580 [Anaerolineae bacterium]